ncbi:radical SAM protein [Desulfobacula toluolica]|uniref:Radical SAM domain protein n=1 Tax=Desulfobacula toluolica (strain DSM 7467 / Tol2) TaxID=651182 RepID=K0NGC1_DESTT|nr:radical SAM protein [Desulfobacula toluolica]CCK78863.1 radical SAM domain protein [Desulfobacula toluolica Tol2]
MQDSPLETYEFETGMYRPPSEGGSASLLVRLTRNCPWNHCTFCAMYKSEKFELRKPEDIIQDINVMNDIYLQIKKISIKLGQEGQITNQAVGEFIKKAPGLYFHPGISMLLTWLASGGKTVFLQDADSLIMKTDHMIQVLNHLKTTFPTIERITSYGRSRTIARKPAADLEKIRKAGLDRLHIGLETGDAALLKKIKKGATPEDHVKGGKKAMEAGFQVSEYWMPGLGGKTFSKDHAANTARILNLINPHYIRSRPFTPRPGTILHEKASRNELDRLTPKEQLLEIKQTLKDLDVTSKVCFDHAGNFWSAPNGQLLLTHDYEGYQFPKEKENLMALIQKGIDHYSSPFIS